MTEQRKTVVWKRKPSNILARLARVKTQYEIGQVVHGFELVKFVGDNPDAEYLIFRCHCGKLLQPRARKNVSQLRVTQGCMDCKRRRDSIAQTERERVKREARASLTEPMTKCNVT